MADTRHATTRSGRPSWLLALLALVMLVAAVWWFWPGDTPGDVPTASPALTEEPPLTAAPETDVVPVRLIVRDTYAWVGRTVSGPVEVVRAEGDRGFWVAEGGEEMLAVLDPAPDASFDQLGFDEGQVLQLQDATVESVEGLPEAQFETPLGQDIVGPLEDADVYLRVHPTNVTLLGN